MAWTEGEWDRLEGIVATHARYVARWTDHGDNTQPGTGNSLENVRADIAILAGTLVDDEAKVLGAVNAVTAKVGVSEQVVLGALAALNLNLSDAQVAAIAAAVSIDEAKVAEAVRFRLSEALAQ